MVWHLCKAPLTPWLPAAQAFETALKTLGMTAQQVLGNKKLLDAILSFHVVPAVVTSRQIKSGQVTRAAHAGCMSCSPPLVLRNMPLRMPVLCIPTVGTCTVLRHLHTTHGDALNDHGRSGGMQEAATLLGKDAKVKLTVAGGKVTVAGPSNKATVVIPDVAAGKSIVHVIDAVVSSSAAGCSG